MVERSGKSAPNSAAKGGREDRLKSALRANLQRRKAQGKARKASEAADTDADPKNRG
ncbi:MAG: hypothetical protein AAFQ82_21500 [Myxococcota bacterium]